ncbi:MAG: hypothetical protein WCR27_07220 [Eubacteriales bacterium]
MSVLKLSLRETAMLSNMIQKADSKSDKHGLNFKPVSDFNGCTCQGNCDGRTSCGCQWG